MKRTVVLLAVAFLAMVAQGAVNTLVPPRFTPDVGLLIVIALGLRWRSTAGGMVLAAALGFTADLLSGSLLGEHALLRLAAFGIARGASRQLNLRGALPQAVFVAACSMANALGVATLNSFFNAGGGLDLAMLGDSLPHAGINGVFAPLASRGIEAVVRGFGDDEGGRPLLRLEPRRRPT